MPRPGELPGIQQADAWFQARLGPLRDPCSRSRFDPDVLHVGKQAVRVRKVRSADSAGDVQHSEQGGCNSVLLLDDFADAASD